MAFGESICRSDFEGLGRGAVDEAVDQDCGDFDDLDRDQLYNLPNLDQGSRYHRGLAHWAAPLGSGWVVGVDDFVTDGVFGADSDEEGLGLGHGRFYLPHLFPSSLNPVPEIGPRLARGNILS